MVLRFIDVKVGAEYDLVHRCLFLLGDQASCPLLGDASMMIPDACEGECLHPLFAVSHWICG